MGIGKWGYNRMSSRISYIGDVEVCYTYVSKLQSQLIVSMKFKGKSATLKNVSIKKKGWG